MNWTPELYERLRNLWAQGMSSGLIAGELGVTRNAVMGAVNRLQLPGRIVKERKPQPPRGTYVRHPRQADGRPQRDIIEEHDRDNRDLDILAHIDAGYGLRETARILGIDQSCVARIVSEAKTREAA